MTAQRDFTGPLILPALDEYGYLRIRRNAEDTPWRPTGTFSQNAAGPSLRWLWH